MLVQFAHRRQIGDRQVVDVERLVEALVGPVGADVDAGERVEQRAVDRVEDQRDDDRPLVRRQRGHKAHRGGTLRLSGLGTGLGPE